MALGGRWGRSEDDDAADTSAASEGDAEVAEAVETQVVEPSEVRTETDPWE